MAKYLEPHIAIGRADGKDIDMDSFIDAFLEWLEDYGHECGGYWKVIEDEEDDQEAWRLGS